MRAQGAHGRRERPRAPRARDAGRGRLVGSSRAHDRRPPADPRRRRRGARPGDLLVHESRPAHRARARREGQRAPRAR